MLSTRTCILARRKLTYFLLSVIFPLTVPKINADKSEDPAECVIDFCSDYLRKLPIQFGTSPDFD